MIGFIDIMIDFIFVSFIALIFFLIGYEVRENEMLLLQRDKWSCTEQVRVGNELPAEYKCTQYTVTAD